MLLWEFNRLKLKDVCDKYFVRIKTTNYFFKFLAGTRNDGVSAVHSRSMALNLPATKLLADDEAFIEKANTFKVSYPRETQIWDNNVTINIVHN